MISNLPRTNSDLSPNPVIYPTALGETLPISINKSKHKNFDDTTERAHRWLVLVASVFLVSVPVFIQAPLVRFLPWFSLALTPLLVFVGWKLLSNSRTRIWGDLLFGFSLTWLSGSIYWGWLRWEPLLHLPIEAVGLPVAIWGVARGIGKIGNLFYLGSLFGTVVTDVYFYLVGLIPHWRSLMQVDPEFVQPIFQNAIARIQTPWGVGWAVLLASLLLAFGLLPLISRQVHWWAFSGAVLSTILVDGLFWLAASTA